MSDKIDPTDKYLSSEEIAKLLRSIDCLEDRTLILFGLETGLRRSEIISIQTVAINYDRQLARVYDFKKDHWRTIVFPSYIGAQLRMYLQARKRESPRLFPFSAKTANRKLKRWCNRASIRLDAAGQTMVSFHWLRHTFIRRSKMAGRDIKVVQQNTGDTIDTILKYYRDLSVEDRIHEVEAKAIIPNPSIKSNYDL